MQKEEDSNYVFFLKQARLCLGDRKFYGKALSLNNAYKQLRSVLSNTLTSNSNILNEQNHLKNTKINKIRISILKEEIELNKGILICK